MNERISTNMIITGVVYLLILIGGIAFAVTLAEEVTGILIASIAFVALSYTIMFALTMFTMMDSDQNIMQNQAIRSLSAIYFVIALAVTFVLNLMHISLKWFLIIEIGIMILGIAAILLGFLGKRHIES